MSCVYIFDIQVTIPPADTTYWCKTFRLPDNIINTTHYMTAVSVFCIQHCSQCDVLGVLYYIKISSQRYGLEMLILVELGWWVNSVVGG